MAYVAGFEDFGASDRAAETIAQETQGAWFARVGAVLAAGVAGALSGFIGTIALGKVDTWIGPAFAGQIYLAALYLALLAEVDTVKRRSWGLMALMTLHIIAMVGWPIALFLLKSEVPAYWLPLPATVTSLIVLAAVAPIRSARAMWLYGGAALMVTALAANQATLFIMGA
ncbi:MAG: hypothetical protein ABUS57_20145 [Pseudomonadota bacterium]